MPLDSDLTLAATVAAELGVSASDPKLSRAISVASDAIRQYLGRKQLHYSATYVDKVPGYGKQRILLDLTPVIAVASVVLADGTVVPPADYSLEDAASGLLYRDGGWPYTGALRPGLLYSDRDAGSEKASITATYAGGWVTPAQNAANGALARTLPFDLEEACVQTAVTLYRKSGTDPNVASEGLGDYNVSYRNPNSLIGVGEGGILPDAVMSILARYRRLV